MSNMIYRNYKDNVFCLLHRKKTSLLELYNAMNNTDYDNEDDLNVVTLPDAICMKYRNDAAYTFNNDLSLYEQQSTDNPNIPLRILYYVTEEYKRIISAKNLYLSTEIKIPTPHFIVFYNGTTPQPEKKIYKLSGLFTKSEKEPELELLVTVLNINDGYNTELMAKCETLRGYMKLVNKVRDNRKSKGMNTEAAVKSAVDSCIEEGILADFFQNHREEVVGMGIFEFDEELYKEALREDGIKIGREDGIKIGREDGRKEGLELNLVNCLNQCLCDDNRTEDLMRSMRDSEFQEKLLKEYGFLSEP